MPIPPGRTVRHMPAPMSRTATTAGCITDIRSVTDLKKSSNGKIKLSANAESAIRQVTGTAVLTAVPVIA